MGANNIMIYQQMAETVERQKRLEEQRRWRRASLSVKVAIEDGGAHYQGFSENISEGGLLLSAYMYLAAKQLTALNNELLLTFTLPGGHAVRAHGTVRWVRYPSKGGSGGPSPGMGLEFKRLDESARAAIRLYVEQSAPAVAAR